MDKPSSEAAARHQDLVALIKVLDADLDALASTNKRILRALEPHADGKQLKGNEVVGWMGEIFARMLLGGKLVEEPDHDLECNDMRISVKARRKTDGGSWKKTSDISRIDGEGCPTHLMFLLFSEDYRLYKVWLFPWTELHGRFKRKQSTRQQGKWYILIKPRDDERWVYQIPIDLPSRGGLA